MQEIIRSISDKISKQEMIGEDSLYFKDTSYRAIPFDQDNFHHLRKNSSQAQLAFIDGGNKEIISASNFSLQFIRVGVVIFKNFEIVMKKTEDFFCLTTIENIGGELYFVNQISKNNTGLLELDKEDIRFRLEDDTLREGIFNTTSSKIGNIIRKFAELDIATNIVKKKLDKGDVIVLDGILQQGVTGEDKFFRRLLDAGMEKDVLISGLAKTSSLITKKGNSPQTILRQMSSGRDDIWYYHPSVEINKNSHPAELYLVRLHPKSRFIFRFELYKRQNMVDIDKVLGYLAVNSQDPVFPGYPYGLIEADNIARVTEEEKNYLELRFKNLSKENELKDRENSAHSILDNIKF